LFYFPFKNLIHFLIEAFETYFRFYLLVHYRFNFLLEGLIVYHFMPVMQLIHITYYTKFFAFRLKAYKIHLNNNYLIPLIFGSNTFKTISRIQISSPIFILFPSSHIPALTLPSSKMYFPFPCCFPFFHSPSYFLPSAQT
jgi:hypothetical protein